MRMCFPPKVSSPFQQRRGVAGHRYGVNGSEPPLDRNIDLAIVPRPHEKASPPAPPAGPLRQYPFCRPDRQRRFPGGNQWCASATCAGSCFCSSPPLPGPFSPKIRRITPARTKRRHPGQLRDMSPPRHRPAPRPSSPPANRCPPVYHPKPAYPYPMTPWRRWFTPRGKTQTRRQGDKETRRQHRPRPVLLHRLHWVLSSERALFNRPRQVRHPPPAPKGRNMPAQGNALGT